MKKLNIGILTDNSTFTTIKDYYNIDVNIVFDFTNNIKEYLLGISIDESSGLYFILKDSKVLPCNIIKRDIEKINIPTLIKINNLEELNLLLNDIDRLDYARYISAYFEQIKNNYNPLDKDIPINKKKTLSLQK